MTNDRQTRASLHQHLAKRLVDLDMLDPGYRMWPDFADPMVDLGFIALGAKLSALMAKRPSAVVEYMLKVGLTRQIQIAGPSNPRARRAYMVSYLRYADLDAMESALGVARRASAFLRAHRGRVRTYSTRLGTVALYGDRRPAHPIFLMYGLAITDGRLLKKEDAPTALRFLFESDVLTVVIAQGAGQAKIGCAASAREIA